MMEENQKIPKSVKRKNKQKFDKTNIDLRLREKI